MIQLYLIESFVLMVFLYFYSLKKAHNDKHNAKIYWDGAGILCFRKIMPFLLSESDKNRTVEI